MLGDSELAGGVAGFEPAGDSDMGEPGEPSADAQPLAGGGA